MIDLTPHLTKCEIPFCYCSGNEEEEDFEDQELTEPEEWKDA